MIITMTAIGIAAAATATYYGPVIIASVAGAVSAVGAAFGGYFYAKSQQEEESEELNALRAELLKREADVRRSAEQLAEQTARDVEGLLQQSKAQQNVLSQQLEILATKTKALEVTSDGIGQTAEKLISTSDELTGCVNSSRHEMDELNVELIRLKQELTDCHASLKRISDSKLALQQNVKEKEQIIGELTQKIETLERLILSNNQLNTLNTYQRENRRLGEELKAIKESLSELVQKCNYYSDTNQIHQELITTLKQENEELTQLLSEFTDTPEAQTSPSSSSRRNHFF